MSNVSDFFSINDLENISGIKAHTIRIWESRYNLFNPERLGRNIRKYSSDDLQKLLNVSMLYNHGLKISKISKLNDIELLNESEILLSSHSEKIGMIEPFKISMYSFDSDMFNHIYTKLLETHSFEEIYIHYFAPLLNFIGLLWQTSSITPAHEHFISNLISQKILLQTAKLEEVKSDDVNVLFLPDGEIHEIGLLFINFMLKKNGKRTIYLGSNISVKFLETISAQFENVHWISHFTVSPTKEEVNTFVNEVKDRILKKSDSFTLIGSKLAEQISEDIRIHYYSSAKEFIQK